jgi:hypothetical protein
LAAGSESAGAFASGNVGGGLKAAGGAALKATEMFVDPTGIMKLMVKKLDEQVKATMDLKGHE